MRFDNAPDGMLLIRKVCAVNPSATLQDAEFKVIYADGTVIGESNGVYRTDENGEILITGLKPGKNVVVTETRAPDGFIIDTQSQTVQVQEGKTVSLTFKNQPKGGIIVQKRDSVTGQPLPGAQFKITNANGELTPDNEGLTSSNGLYTTDENGQIVLSKLLPGTYVVAEEKAPDNYRKDPTPQTVVVNPADTQTLRFYDDPLCTLTILKRDAVTKKPLAKAEFLVRDSEGRAIGPNNGIYITGTDGTATVTGLEPNATIVVGEIKAPSGYILDETPKNIVVRSGVANSLIFDDQPGTTLIIKKFIEGTENEPLTGAVFHVTDEDGAAIGTNNGRYTTDRNGLITITGLQPGQVIIVTEEKAPDGYVKNATPKTIKIKQDVANSLIFENAHAGSLVINKRSSVDKKTPLEGVTFKITTTSGEFLPDENGRISSNGLYYTDENGQIILKSVVGTVVVTEQQTIDGYVISDANRTQTVEVKTVDGYILDGTPQSIKIEAGKAQNLTFWNKPAGSLVIRKLDKLTGKPLAGVEFLVTDSSGAVVGSNNGYFTTDKDGRISIPGLTPGTTITVKETKTLDGYILDGIPQSIEIKEGESQSLTFWNKKAGGLIVNKVDAVTGEPLVGVTFKITYADGSNVDMDGGKISSNGIYTTDSFVIDRKNFLFANTPSGATSSAVIFSLIQTAMENGLDPYRYLSWLMSTAAEMDLSQPENVQLLLPWNAPLKCRTN